MNPTPSPTQSATPWTGKPRLIDILCLVFISLTGVYYLALAPLRPLLLADHTLLLIVLSGSTESLVAGGAYVRVDRLPLAWVLVAALFGLMKFDILYWWAGRLWGPRFLELFAGRPGSSGRWKRWIGWWQRRLSRLAARFTPVAVVIAEFVPIPSGILYAAAGWEGMSLAAFLFFDAIGEMLWGGLLIWLGYGFGQRAVQVVDTISRFGLWFALAIIAIVVARVVWSTWRGRHPAPPSAAPLR